jgi:integrase
MFKGIVILAITTGLRRGEIAGLEWKHINLDKGVIRVEQQMIYTKKVQHQITDPKSTDGNRKVSIPPFVIDLLKLVRKQTMKDRDRLGSNWKGDNRQFVLTLAPELLTNHPISP